MNPWVIIGFIVALAGAWYAGDLHGVKVTDQKWTLAAEKQKDDAAQLKAQLTDQVRAAESHAADLASQLESTRAQSDQQTATNDARVGDLLGQLRRQQAARCRGGGTGSVPGGQISGGPQNTATGSQGGLSDPVDNDYRECTRSANVLAAYARECNAFALSLQH